MYLIGFLLAAYYDWWVQKVRPRPGFWLFGILLTQIPIVLIVAEVFRSVGSLAGILTYFTAALALVPAGYAAHFEYHKQQDLEQERTKQLRKIWKLMDRK